MQSQYDNMVKGQPPADYANQGVDESLLDGFQGFKSNEELFKKLMGF